MPTLRLTQSDAGPDSYRVEVALEGDGLPRQTAPATFGFQLTAQDQEDLRWYLEDYLQYPQDPASTIAARIHRERARRQRQTTPGQPRAKQVAGAGHPAAHGTQRP